MGIFSGIKNKIKGIDPFYEQIKNEEIGLYQHYFNKIILSIDISNQTKWSKSQGYNKEQLDKDDDLMENIIINEAKKDGLIPRFLQVMLNQYFFADVYQRENIKDSWVKKVIYRKDIDYFPDGWSMCNLLEKLNE